MNPKALRAHGSHVDQFARAVPNMGRLGDLTRAIMEMLRSGDWRDYSDATGVYHFLPGEFDYFLALQTVERRDIARLYLTPEERAELAMAMDRTRTGEVDYRRPLEEVMATHKHAAQSLTRSWTQYAWDAGRYPVGSRALVISKTGVSPEENARQARMKRLRQLSSGWRARVERVVAAADGFSREELMAAIDALRQLAKKAPRLNDGK